MRITYIFIFTITSIYSYSQDINMSEIREAYIQSDKNKKNVIRLLNICEKNKHQAIINGYKITAEMMLLSYQYNPIKKFQIFNQKCTEMDSLIEKNILNLEIRLLRYCLQKESPNLLGYNNKLEEDLNFILKNINNKSIELQEFTSYILKSLEDK